MINLDDITPFAEGGNRMCFVHPNNPKTLLLVTINLALFGGDPISHIEPPGV